MKKKRSTTKKTNKHAKKKRAPESDEKDPKSFVISIGAIGSSVKTLLHNLRDVMEPNTATKLKVMKNNRIKDFVKSASLFSVTHLIILSQTQKGVYLRLCRIPQGPTVTFRVESYSVSSDVSPCSKPLVMSKLFSHPPCLITNLLPDTSEKHLALVAHMLKEVFPAINPHKVSVGKLKRCCLIHYDEETSLFNLRHYAIRLRNAGSTDARVKTETDSVKSECLSDEGDSHVIRERKAAKSAINLKDIGPRLSFKLYKIEDGLLEGTVLYHEYVSKTAEEVLACSKKRQDKMELKLMRKRQQEENLKRNVERREAKMMKKKVRRAAKYGDSHGGNEVICKELKGKEKKIKEFQEQLKTYQNEETGEVDDDAEYYKHEVGDEPEPELFGKRKKSVRFSVSKKSKNESHDDKKTQPVRQIGFAIRKKKM